MIKKLRQNKGETLVETLFALLIAVMSIGLIAASVSTATKISERVAEMDAKYKQDLQKVECREGTPQTGEPRLKITFRDENGINLIETVTPKVKVYGGTDDAFVSYSYDPVLPGGGT